MFLHSSQPVTAHALTGLGAWDNMKILWISAAPWNITGYGNITREMLTRMKADGHEVWCGCKHNTGSWMEWEGHQIFQTTNIPLVNAFADAENIDYIITLLDTWAVRTPYFRWIPYFPIDTQYVSPMVTKSIEPSIAQIAMSMHGQQQLKEHGYNPYYAPHAVDTDVFSPCEDSRVKVRKVMEWNGKTFVIGAVGANYPDDRKGFIPLLQAYSRFVKRHPDSALYIHTRVIDDTSNCPLALVADKLDIGDNVMFANQLHYGCEKIRPIDLAAIYNAFDVHCLPTRGEGFGLPIMEAQACGVPSITTATTSGPELTKGGWLIDVDTDKSSDDMAWSPMKTWRAEVRASQIDEKLEEAYVSWKNGSINEIGEQARAGALEYDWDYVYPTYWKPIFKRLESMKDEVREKEHEARKSTDAQGMAALPTWRDFNINAK